MERHYKSFMDKQQPSEDLLSETISKAKTSAREMQESKDSNDGDFMKKTEHILKPGRRKWQYGIAAFVLVCLSACYVWHWNATSGSIKYMDLVVEFSPDEDSDYIDKRKEEFGEERNSYLDYDPTYFYVFDKDAEKTEVKLGEGSVIVQTGAVKIAGNQLLYQIKPQKIKGIEVFLGKMGNKEEKKLYAAFDLGDIHYYLVGENITEREMTSYIRDLIKDYKEKK